MGRLSNLSDITDAGRGFGVVYWGLGSLMGFRDYWGLRGVEGYCVV